MKRGRKPKIRLTFNEEKQKALEKHKNGIPLTLEETAYAMAESEETMLSPMGIQKIENRALNKLKKAFCTDYEIENISDLINSFGKFS